MKAWPHRKGCTLSSIMKARRFRPAARLAGTTAALFSLPFVHQAERSDFILVWNAPPECPAGEVVREEINKRLGSRQRGLVLRASATVTREASAFRVQLQTYDNRQRGVRELEAPTCEALVEAISLIVALAVDPALLGQEEGSEEEGSPPEEPALADPIDRLAPGTGDEPGAPGTQAGGQNSGESAPNREAAGSRGAAPKGAQGPSTSPNRHSGVPPEDPGAEPAGRLFRDLGLQGVASLAGSLESGILPGLGFGITARGGMRLRRVRLEAAISRWFERKTSSAAGPGTKVGGMSLATWGCFRAVPAHTAPVPRLRSALPPDDAPAIEASPCVGAEFGRLDVESFGVSDPSKANGSYFAAGGALRLGATAAEWLSLDVRFEALRVLHRPEFEVENIGVIFQPRNWSLRAALGAEAYFP